MRPRRKYSTLEKRREGRIEIFIRVRNRIRSYARASARGLYGLTPRADSRGSRGQFFISLSRSSSLLSAASARRGLDRVRGI